MELDLTSATATAYEARSKPNESYRYQVRACHRNDNDLCTDPSGSPITVNVFQASAPTWTSTVTSSNSGTYTLSWTSAGAFANYELRENTMGLPLTPSTTATTHEISDKQDASYRYQVRACHQTDGELCTTWSGDLIVTVSIDCRETTPQSSGFRGGGGTKASPYLICNYDQLKKMRDSLTSHYRLGAHIDAIGSRSEGGRRAGAGTTCTKYNGMSGGSSNAGNDATCTGWAPVGTSNTNAFTGSLQGAGYTIRNLYISIKTTTNRVGLFGETGSASVIQNVGVTDAHIRSDVNSSRVGGLVGRNQGILSNSYATGSVTGNGSSSRVGGLVGG